MPLKFRVGDYAWSNGKVVQICKIELFKDFSFYHHQDPLTQERIGYAQPECLQTLDEVIEERLNAYMSRQMRRINTENDRLEKLLSEIQMYRNADHKNRMIKDRLNKVWEDGTG